jgi:hypothetical protein
MATRRSKKPKSSAWAEKAVKMANAKIFLVILDISCLLCELALMQINCSQ